MIRYRPDIDGLRAIAVVSVVLFHAGFQWISGGFIGVDVFFVISGFLITKIISREIASSSFSIAQFYMRRAKRILPALFAVLGACFIAGCILLLPSELKPLGKHIATTGLFISNLSFWREGNLYFSGSEDLNPLLHTWSLSVEEQFYLFWPILLVFTQKTRATKIILPVMAIVSFALSCYTLSNHQTATFYLLPTRAWELCMGAVLALELIPSAKQGFQRHILSCLGLGLIIAPSVILTKASLFPGWNALLPCLGASMLIYVGPEAVVNRRLLSQKAVVFIGLISYSLYLWHWPLFAFARILHPGRLPLSMVMMLIALALLLSIISCRYIEAPFRKAPAGKYIGRRLSLYAAASIVFILTGSVTYATGGFPSRMHADVLAAVSGINDINPVRDACLPDPYSVHPLMNVKCGVLPKLSKPTIAVWGDSHGDAISPAISAFAAAHHHGFAQLTVWSCPPLVNVQFFGYGKPMNQCATHNQEVMEYLRSMPMIDTVILASKWAAWSEADTMYLMDKDHRETTKADTRSALSTALYRTVQQLTDAGKKVIILGEVPEPGVNVPLCLGHTHLPLYSRKNCTIDTQTVAQRTAYTNRLITQITAKNKKVCSFLPIKTMCSGTACITSVNGHSLYYDDQHLSVTGARWLTAKLPLAQCLPPDQSDGPRLSQ